MSSLRIKFFITPVYPYGNDHYYHEMVALAEGFEELGHQVCGNTNYWFLKEEDRYLIPECTGGRFDLGVYDYRYVRSFEHLLFRPGRPNFSDGDVHILIDRNDWISPFWLANDYETFDRIFAGNLFQGKSYPQNVRPWAMGLTKRVMLAIDSSYSSNASLNEEIVYNFRTPHNLRKIILEKLERCELQYPLIQRLILKEESVKLSEVEEDYYKSTTGRHLPEYFKVLNQSLLVLSVCGYWEYRPILYQPYSLLARMVRRPYILLDSLMMKLQRDLSRSRFVFQHDSFRFYEVLYSASCPIHVDLQAWGFWMPQMPTSGEHYLGIIGFDVQHFVDQLNSLTTEDILEIGRKGRHFCKAYYSPRAQAQRILSELGLLQSEGPALTL